MQVVTASMKVVAFVCVTAIVVLAALKLSAKAQHSFVLNKKYHITNVVIGAVATGALVAMASMYVWRIRESLRAGRVWTRRRIEAVRVTSLRAVIMTTVAGAYTAGHAVVLADPHAVCDARAAAWLGAVRWIGWNTLLFTLIFDAHGLVPRRGARGRIDGAVRDLPLRVHWQKGILWCIFTGARCTYGRRARVRHIVSKR
jgi:hypothetical protein